jgi:hypothetical protein
LFLNKNGYNLKKRRQPFTFVLVIDEAKEETG